MKNLIIKLLISALLLIVGDFLFDSVTINGFLYAILLAIILGVLNSFVKPVLKILAFPLTIITFGLFSFVITAIIILIADGLMGTHFETSGFLSALGFGIVIGLFNSFADLFISDKE